MGAKCLDKKMLARPGWSQGKFDSILLYCLTWLMVSLGLLVRPWGLLKVEWSFAGLWLIRRALCGSLGAELKNSQITLYAVNKVSPLALRAPCCDV